MVIVALLLCLDIAYLASGSLEQFPTAEQEDKVRQVTTVIAIALLAAEAVLWLAYRSLAREAGSPSRVTDGVVPPGE